MLSIRASRLGPANIGAFSHKNFKFCYKAFCCFRTILTLKIVCLRWLRVSVHDIGRSLLWRHEKAHCDHKLSFFWSSCRNSQKQTNENHPLRWHIRKLLLWQKGCCCLTRIPYCLSQLSNRFFKPMLINFYSMLLLNDEINLSSSLSTIFENLVHIFLLILTLKFSLVLVHKRQHNDFIKISLCHHN